MEEDNSKNGFFKNWIVKNILGAILFFLALLIVATFLLNAITNHGRTVTVPDLTSMSLDDARRTAADSHLKVAVVDSIYIRKMEKGAVFSQTPKSGSVVKRRRRILLTINAVTAKKVGMPNLIGLSMRQAKAELNSRGLSLGKLIYVDDIATNNIIRQVYNNRSIKAGKQIDSGSEIDLVVGLNPSDNQTFIPNVMGMKYLRALDAIHDNSLNTNKIVFDKNIRTYSDSINASVVRQSPAASSASVLMGSEVSLHLSLSQHQD